MAIVIDALTKKLIYPSNHIWYVNNLKLNQIIPKTEKLYITSLIQNPSKTIQSGAIKISSANSNLFLINYQLVKNASKKYKVLGQINDINNIFVDDIDKLSNRSDIELKTLISTISILMINRLANESNIIYQLKQHSNNQYPLDKAFNYNILKKAKQLVQNAYVLLTKFQGTNYKIAWNDDNFIKNLLGVKNNNVDFWLVNKRFINNSKKDVYKHLIGSNRFNQNKLKECILNRLFVNKDLFAFCVDKNAKRTFIYKGSQKYTSQVPKNLINYKFDKVSFNENLNEFSLLDTKNKFSFNLKINRSVITTSISIKNQTKVIDLNTFKHIFKIDITSKTNNTYIDNLSALRKDLDDLDKYINSSWVLNNKNSSLDQIVDLYPDLDVKYQTDVYNLIQFVKQLINRLENEKDLNLLIDYLTTELNKTNTLNLSFYNIKFE